MRVYAVNLRLFNLSCVFPTGLRGLVYYPRIRHLVFRTGVDFMGSDNIMVFAFDRG
jgi:hypothetical protein